MKKKKKERNKKGRRELKAEAVGLEVRLQVGLEVRLEVGLHC